MGDRILARNGRVSIRKFARRDVRDRLEWPLYTDPFFAHLNYDLGNFIERERWLFPRIMNTGRIYFAVEDENAKLIGEMSLRDIEPHKKASRLGIHLAGNKLGQAYGREALSALLSYYFRVMEWNVMFLDVAAYNFRAIRLYERLHFSHIAPFWRTIIVDESVLTDQRYADIRQFLRVTLSAIEGLHYDMSLTKERYLEALRADGEPAQGAAYDSQSKA